MKILPALAAFSLVACATTEKPRDARLLNDCQLLWLLLKELWSDT